MTKAVSNQDETRDERLAELLVQITEQRQLGEPPDIQALIEEHPDLGPELHQLANIALLAEDFANASIEKTPQLSLAAARAWPVGTLPRQFATYELREEIGRGGMGVVYKAWDERLRRNVALKMILRREHASDEDLERFRVEAQAAAGLSHPNIVRVYDVGEHEGQAYFSMQYVEGVTLADLVNKAPIASKRAAKYMIDIALAVHHAHEQGLLHRDLKPSNVLIGTDNSPLVTDFGLAKRVEGGASLTNTGNIVGTPSYMSPEQTSDSSQVRITAASDVYSLGAILYEMLTGRPPFQGANVLDVLLQVQSEEPIRPRLLNSKLDPDLELICLKCLEKRPEHRYKSAEELAADLQRYRQSEPVMARSSSLVYFVGRLFRETHHAPIMENWGILWMWHAGLIFLLCLVTNIMYWSGLNSEEDHMPYLLLWSVGLVVWGMTFWYIRRLSGPVSFVERQVAHAWAAGVIASIGTFVVEVLLKSPVLELTPVLAIMTGMIFLFKAGTLTGWFYIAATLCFLAAAPMSQPPVKDFAPLLFGIISAIGFFVPGLRYYRQKRNTSQHHD